MTGSKNLKTPATRVLRRPFELRVMTEVTQDLRSGDLSIPGSDRYSDYRGELVTEEEFQEGLAPAGGITPAIFQDDGDASHWRYVSTSDFPRICQS